MAEESTSPAKRPLKRTSDPATQDALSSFTVWSHTTMLGAEDDADLAENDVVLRGID